MTTFDDAVRVLETGERTAVMSLLLGLTDTERKALGPTFRHRLTHPTSFDGSSDAACLSVLATASGHRQALLFTSHAWRLSDTFVDDAVRLLAHRSPAWLPAFTEAILDSEGQTNWRLARGLVRAGLVGVPENPEYYRGTVRGLPDYNFRQRRPLVDQLAQDPGLIGDHLLAMLSAEGAGRLLAFHDHYLESTYEHQPDITPFTAGSWLAALLAVVADGRLDHGKLLDTVLAAPLRDWAAADLGWYAVMHDALAPTADEVAGRQQTYTRLLTVEHGPSVKLAQRELARILERGDFQPEPFLAASAAALSRSDKTSVSAQLRLLEKLHKAHPDLPLGDTIRVATGHPRPDVREQAARLLARLGEAVATAEPAAAFAIPVVEAHPAAPAIGPIASADELAEVLLALLEDLDPLELERAIDGLLRFADSRPRTADLLLKRAGDARIFSDDPRLAVAALARAWLTPRRRFRDGDWSVVLGHTIFPANAAAPATIVGAIGRRLTGIAYAIRAGPHSSVAMPSRADGTIDPGVLSRRLAGLDRRAAPPEFELALALLRVPTEDRAGIAIPPALRPSRTVSRVLGMPPHSWQRRVVAYRRTNWEPEHRILVFADAAAREGDALDGILARRQPDETAGRETEYGEYEPRFEQTLALAALLLPHDPATLAAHAHPYLFRDLRKDRSVSVAVIDALARARTANGGPESSALVLGLAAKDARARTAAQDAVFDLARHGRLDGASLGQQAVLHLADDIVVGQRISAGLSEVARTSDACVLPVLDALQTLLPALSGRRDAGAFVELAADLAERTAHRIRLPDELHTLATSKSSSLLAKAARRLL